MRVEYKRINKLIISHRGNTHGPIKELENNPSYITETLKNYNVEVDVWFDGKWWTGHDNPTYEIPFSFLWSKGLWVHCKNIEAITELFDSKINYFWHQNDDIAITSSGYVWTFPGRRVTHRSIAVLPETNKNWDISNALGVCTDFTIDYENSYII